MAAFARTSTARAAQATSGRSIPYILSTSAVARDKHMIDQAGWSLENYLANPVLLWCHDNSEPPIGRVSGVTVTGEALRGTVDYADAETYPFADTIFRLVKGKFINAVSVSWNPMRWAYSTDRDRPGGIDFKEQELLEVSQVPVPSDIGAIATARAHGIDTAPLATWVERALDQRKGFHLPQLEMEALYRSAHSTPRSAAGIRSKAYNFTKHETSADRLNTTRFEAYESARRFGLEVPARFLPARTRSEREAIIAQLHHALR